MNDMMMEQLGTSGYRFIRHSNRPISVVFDEVPDRRISTGTRNLTQAIRFAERFIASGRLEELKERVEAAKNPTLAEFAKDFFLRTDADSYRRYSEAHNRISSDNAYQSHQSRLDLYIIPKFGKRRLVDLCARDIDRWLTIEIKGKKVKDPTSGMRMFNKKMIAEFALNLNYGPEPDTISYLLKQGATIAEVQVQMDERIAGESYLNVTKSMMYMLRMLLSILFIQNFRKRREVKVR